MSRVKEAEHILHSMTEEEMLARIAWFYYHDNLTQGEIGKRLDIPRLKVSRLLEKGRQLGVIKVQINSRFTGCLELEEALQQYFHLKHIRVLPALEQHEINTRLGIGASQMLMSLMKPNQLMAIGFGETIMQTIKYCNEFITSNQLKLITLSGGVGPYMKGIGELDGSCSISIIPAPLRASSVEAARLFKREACVRDIMLAAGAADVAIVGIGSTQQKGQATLIRSGYINEEGQQELRSKGAIGDILGYFMQHDGTLQPDIPLHDELISLPLEKLVKIPTVIGIAGGENKVDAILSALNGKYINSLVTEEKTAKMILAQIV
ncbi:transcriptional regulator LsrR [Testudinibacter sp. TR-2022]|uniref:transcriptional regulator LsrR n=1 Tax=Testudinibacter sp. TR-2022 TaxID=2585029 RepID=UPI00111ACC28|nr:transcriptional regulator LsrR [Testudinibacter sp. TR-2022]TNH06170.1 transcriptional regulator LsrR [Pasteurellaceae bacterium Phil11]TNH24889.1 transcriptional regulator LsrR [Testudinibacter sp. TR-2022]TNH25985.1 transcriptional regulator LsrR [Testudinibacter sp. TR-2022]